MSEKILVACIGNIFLGDDGFGFEVAQALAGRPLASEVEVRDFGIRGLDLAYTLLQKWRAVILVDAIARGGAPGTLYLLEPADRGSAEVGTSADPHSMEPASVLAMARSLGPCPAPVYIVGCEPEDLGDELEGRIGLTQTVDRAVPEAVRMIQQLTKTLTQAAVPAGAAATGGEP